MITVLARVCVCVCGGDDRHPSPIEFVFISFTFIFSMFIRLQLLIFYFLELLHIALRVAPNSAVDKQDSKLTEIWTAVTIFSGIVPIREIKWWSNREQIWFTLVAFYILIVRLTDVSARQFGRYEALRTNWRSIETKRAIQYFAVPLIALIFRSLFQSNCYHFNFHPSEWRWHKQVAFISTMRTHEKQYGRLSC